MAEKKQHPEHVMADERIASAIGYRVTFSRGRVDGEFIVLSEDVTTLAEVPAVVERLNTLYGKSGRRACVYALLANGKAEPMGSRYGVQSTVYKRRELGY